MKTALIGYTGFVGTNLLEQTSFTDLYNSKNIQDIKGKRYDLVVSAGNSSIMWKANQNPEEDWRNIAQFMENISTVKTNRFVLFSTIEVYDKTYNVNEDSVIDLVKTKPYGQHRYKLEQFISKQFSNSSIIRLPNLFGIGLKKNFVYDLIHNNRWDLTHKDSIQQWYNLENIWRDISIVIDNSLSLINFAVEPIINHELAEATLTIDFSTITETPPKKYDMRSKYASFFNSPTEYLYQKDETIKALRDFMKKVKGKRHA